MADPKQNTDESKSYWKSTKGFITGLTGVIVAVGGLIVAVDKAADWFSPEGGQQEGNGAIQQNADAQTLFEDSFSEESVLGQLNPISHSSPDNQWTVITGDWYIDDGVLHGVPHQQTSDGTPIWGVIALDHDLPDGS